MQKIVKYLKVILGCGIIAITLNLFFKDMNLIPSGMFGFTTLYNAKTDMNLALCILLANIFFITLGFLFTSKKELKRTILPFILIPLFTFLTSDIVTLLDLSKIDRLLIALYGGVLMGFGYRFIYKEDFYASGTDIISIIASKLAEHRRNFINYIIDTLWITIGIFMYGLEGAMYSLIAILIMEFISHRSTLGVSDSKVFYIITKKENEVREYIINELHYELTIFDVKGGFLKTKNKVLMSVIPTKDYYKLKEGIKMIDPKAFISITDSYEVVNPTKSPKKRDIKVTKDI